MQQEWHPPFIQSAEFSNRVIANRYRLSQLLGKGSFGQVFYAEDVRFEPAKAVALKLLHSQFLNEPQLRADLKREASLLARFNHPNILQVLDFDITPDLAYLVTNLAEGGSLATKMRPDPTQPPVQMPLSEVAWYLEQLSEALDEAHAQGMVHRDIKPANILLDKRGRPLLADFGLAAALGSSTPSMLVDTSLSGTPLYMAPEQWKGQVSKASDIYALAVVVYQLITGQAPFQGNQAALAYQHLTEPVPPLSKYMPELVYPAALDEVLAEAMAKQPNQRIRPAGEFYRRFRQALGGPSSDYASVHSTLPLNLSFGPKVTQPKMAEASSEAASDPVTILAVEQTTPAGKISRSEKEKKKNTKQGREVELAKKAKVRIYPSKPARAKKSLRGFFLKLSLVLILSAGIAIITDLWRPEWLNQFVGPFFDTPVQPATTPAAPEASPGFTAVPTILEATASPVVTLSTVTSLPATSTAVALVAAPTVTPPPGPIPPAAAKLDPTAQPSPTPTPVITPTPIPLPTSTPQAIIPESPVPTSGPIEPPAPAPTPEAAPEASPAPENS